MAVDIYLRTPEDPNFDFSQLEVEDSVANFVQYIEMLLTTSKGEVFGDPEFGCNLEAYLWNQTISTGSIMTEINREILLHCPESCGNIPYELEISFFKGDLYDTMIVDIIIDGRKVLGIAATPQNAKLENSFR
jgi:hypothetical protein